MLGPPNRNAPPVPAGEASELRPVGTGLNAKDNTDNRDVYTRERYRLDSIIKRLLRADAIRRDPRASHPANTHRQIGCTWVRIGDVSMVKPVERPSYHFKGLKICGSVWVCPLCACKIQERRRLEVAAALMWASSQQKGCVMVSYTFPHRVDQPLSLLIKLQQDAIKKLRESRAYTSLMKEAGSTGRIRTLEVTHGQNGWHPHTHELLFISDGYDGRRLQGRLAAAWLKACRKVGLFVDGRDKEDSFLWHSVDVTEGDEGAACYIAKMDDQSKWGLSHEMTKSSSKQGRSAGSHPFKLAAQTTTTALFLEYVWAMKNARQLVWSRGLKDAVGIEEKTDEEIASEESMLVHDRIPVGIEEWRMVLRFDARAELIMAAQADGVGGVVQVIRNLRARNEQK